MGKIKDELWFWVSMETEEIISLKDEIDFKYSLPKVPNTTLYHYTDANGLKGIVESKSLWLTDINYMNDAGELKYAQNLIDNVIKDLGKEFQEHNIFFDKIRLFSDPFKNSFDVYITCFCEEGNLLSQWRSYGLYSVGFNAEKPIRVNPSTFKYVGDWYKCTLRKVEYNKEKQINTIKDIISGLFELYKNQLENSTKNPEMIAQGYASVFSNFMIQYVTCFKDEIFKEEKEWRLIHIQENDKNDRLKFRSSSEYLIPYLEGKLKTIDEEDFEKKYHDKPIGVGDQEKYVNHHGVFPIKEILIGPDPHLEIAKKAAQKFLKKNGLLNCQVKSSTSRLRRNW